MRDVSGSRAINPGKQPSSEDGSHDSEDATAPSNHNSGGEQSVDKTPEQLAREQKIAALKRAVESGTYRIKSDKVAEAIISEIAKREK
jgi:anti-sigma28 factor (negative regulator of flagellin synthesis)